MSGHNITAWSVNESEVQVGSTITYPDAGFFLSLDAGITRDGLAWFLESGGRGNPDISWFDTGGSPIGKISVPHEESRVIAVGEEAVIYLCGTHRNRRPECLALEPGDDEPLWQVQLEGRTAVVGGALVPGLFYVATQDGGLYAIGAGL